MDYTNYQNPSLSPEEGSNNAFTNNSISVRTIEPNRSETESTEQRLYGAYRNTDKAVRNLTPVSTPEAPLIYPFVDVTNPNEANILNRQTQPPMMNQESETGTQQVPMPPFTSNRVTPSTRVPELYTPMVGRTVPSTTQPSTNNVRSNTSPTTNRAFNNSTPMPTSMPSQTNGMNSQPRPEMPPQPMPRGFSQPTPGMPSQPMPREFSQPTLGMPSQPSAWMSSQPMSWMYSQPMPEVRMPDYQMNNSQNMYLPARNTPYYNLSSNGYEDLNDFEEAERDMEYLKQFYPNICQLLLGEIEEECDKLEYEGSAMFDEYPDKVTMDRIIQRICARIKNNGTLYNYESSLPSNQVSANQVFFNRCPGCDPVEDFVRILFFNELHNRRRRHRNRRRWFY